MCAVISIWFASYDLYVLGLCAAESGLEFVDIWIAAH